MIAWDYIKKDTRVYIIEDDVVYFYRNNRSYKSFIEAKDFGNQSEEDRVIDLFYWLP